MTLIPVAAATAATPREADAADNGFSLYQIRVAAWPDAELVDVSGGRRYTSFGKIGSPAADNWNLCVIATDGTKYRVKDTSDDNGHFSASLTELSATEAAQCKTFTMKDVQDASGVLMTLPVWVQRWVDLEGTDTNIVYSIDREGYLISNIGTGGDYIVIPYRNLDFQQVQAAKEWTEFGTINDGSFFALAKPRASSAAPTVTQVPTTGAPSSDLLASAVVVAAGIGFAAVVVSRRRRV